MRGALRRERLIYRHQRYPESVLPVYLDIDEGGD
jgi:hypothetical protein